MADMHGRSASLRLLQIALIGILASCPASAQSGGGSDASGSARIRHACQLDYQAHCTGEDPAPAIERACLAQYFMNLSAACQAALRAGRAGQSSGQDQGGADLAPQ